MASSKCGAALPHYIPFSHILNLVVIVVIIVIVNPLDAANRIRRHSFLTQIWGMKRYESFPAFIQGVL